MIWLGQGRAGLVYDWATVVLGKGSTGLGVYNRNLQPKAAGTNKWQSGKDNWETGQGVQSIRYSAFEHMDTPYCANYVLCPLYGKALCKYYDNDEQCRKHSLEVKKCEIEKHFLNSNNLYPLQYAN